MPDVLDVFWESLALVKDNYLKVLALNILLFIVFGVIGVVIAAVAFSVGLAGALGTIGMVHSLSPGMLATVVKPFVIFLIIICIAALFVTPIWIGAYYSLAQQALSKKQISVIYALRQAMARYWKLLLTDIMQSAITLVVLALISAPLAFSVLSVMAGVFSGGGAATANSLVARIAASAGNYALTLMLLFFVTFIVAAAVSFILSVLLFEALPLVMLKNMRGVTAIKGSIGIGKKNFWDIAGLLVVVGLFDFAIWTALHIALGVLGLISPTAAAFSYLLLAVLLEAFIVGVFGFVPIVFYKRYVGRLESLFA